MLKKERKDHTPVGGNGREKAVAALGTRSRDAHRPDGTHPSPGQSGGDLPHRLWGQLAPHLPEVLQDWSALDIGCGAGHQALELARRGARVTAIDPDPRSLRQGRRAAEELGLAGSVTFRQMGVYDLAWTDGAYDLVLFMGGLSRARDPLLALDLVAARVRRVLVFQSPTIPGEQVLENTFDRGLHDREALRDPGWPAIALQGHPASDPPARQWIPTHAGVEAMLRSSGLRIIARPGPELYLCEPDPEHPSCVTTWNAAELQAALRALEMSARPDFVTDSSSSQSSGGPHQRPPQARGNGKTGTMRNEA